MIFLQNVIFFFFFECEVFSYVHLVAVMHTLEIQELAKTTTQLLSKLEECQLLTDSRRRQTESMVSNLEALL